MKTLSTFCSRQEPGNSETSLRFDKHLILRCDGVSGAVSRVLARISAQPGLYKGLSRNIQ